MIKELKKIIFCKAIRQRINTQVDIIIRNKSEMTKETYNERLDRLYDLDEKVWDKMEFIRKELKNKYFGTRELRSKYRVQVKLACRLLKLEYMDIIR